MAAVPLSPTIDLLLRKSGKTFLSWTPVTLVADGGDAALTKYRIYRSTDGTLENFVAVVDVVNTDSSGNLLTVFHETLAGFYAYAVAAVNATGEGLLSQPMAAIDADDPDSI